MKQTILAIGDIHGKDVWKKAPFHRADKIVFLGDYVDAFDKSDVEITTNLEEIIQFKKDNMDKVILLLGNHDIQYYYSYDQFGCSGYRAGMYQVWHILFQDNKELFQVAYQSGSYLFTHAGVSKGWLSFREGARMWSRVTPDPEKPSREDILNELGGSNLAEKLCRMHLSRHYPKLHVVGDLRGGIYASGGITWADIKETMYGAIDHYHQVVGHSRIKQPITNNWGTGSITYIDVLDQKEPLFGFIEMNDSYPSTVRMIDGKEQFHDLFKP